MRVALIPARGGSKGLPRKNIKPLAGKPLIAWSIESALNSRSIDAVIVSTEDDEIADISKSFGAEVIKRPLHLASDEATTIAVLRDVAEKTPNGNEFVVLQPTSPLRSTGLIDSCIEAFSTGEYTNLATGYWCQYQEFGSHNNRRRQDYKGFFYDDGNVYILKRELALQERWYGNNICRFITKREENFEIDDEFDFMLMEYLIKKYGDINE